MSLVSVIIPMFNSEKFVGTCVDSVLQQTFDDFEVVIVDDCSTDRSLEIVKSYNDPRIKLFKQPKNCGRSVARNIGLEYAQGEFVFFMDSDDAILPNTLQTLTDAMQDCDAVYMNSFFNTTDENFSLTSDIKVEKIFSRNANPRTMSFDIIERLQSEYIFGGTMVNTWIRISRKDFLKKHQIYFPILPRNEDGLVHLATLCFAKKIRVIDSCCYIYRSHSNNSMHQSAQKHFKLTLESLVPAINYVEHIFENMTLSIENQRKIEAFTLKEMIRWLIVQHAYAGEMKFDDIDQILQQNLNIDKKTSIALFHAIAFVLNWIYNRQEESIFTLTK